jgi:hypothetical protein
LFSFHLYYKIAKLKYLHALPSSGHHTKEYFIDGRLKVRGERIVHASYAHVKGQVPQQHILGFAIGLCDYVLVKKDICN